MANFCFLFSQADHLLFCQCNLSPNFKIRERKDSRLMAVLTSQIIIRMFDEYSYPVKTPSYIPQIAFYFLTGHKESANKLTLFGKLTLLLSMAL